MAREPSRQQSGSRLEPLRASGAARRRACLRASPRDSTPWCWASRRSWASSRMPTASRRRPAAPAPRSISCFRRRFRRPSACAPRRRSAPTPSRSPRPPSSLARRMYADLSERTALMIGAGEMIELTARHFASAGVKRLVIANRTLARAQALAAEIKGHAVDLEQPRQGAGRGGHRHQLHGEPAAADHQARRRGGGAQARRHRPIFMVDLAVPRDIEPAVAELDDVYLFSIDDLQQLVEENLQQREVGRRRRAAADRGGSGAFLAETRAQDAGPAIRALRQQADAIRAADRGAGPAHARRRQIHR